MAVNLNRPDGAPPYVIQQGFTHVRRWPTTDPNKSALVCGQKMTQDARYTYEPGSFYCRECNRVMVMS